MITAKDLMIIVPIIQRKKQGIDCTEQESVEIKGYIKEYKGIYEQKLVEEIQELFPLEYGEALDEIENIKY